MTLTSEIQVQHYIYIYIHMFFFLGIFQSWKPCHFLTCSSMEETSRRWPNIIFSLGEYDNLPRHTLSMSKLTGGYPTFTGGLHFFAGVCQYGRLKFPMHQITKVIRWFHPPLVIFPAIKAPWVRGFPCGPPSLIKLATGHWWFSHRPLLGVQTDLWCAVWMWGASIASLAVQTRASHGFAYCFLHLCLILLQSLICVYLILCLTLFIYIYTVYYIYSV